MYHSTRNKDEKVSFSEAVIRGLAPDGGLYVPETIPKIDIKDLHARSWDYKAIAKFILGLYLDDFTEEQVSTCVERAYTGKFNTDEICPVNKVGERFYLELFHGPTLAFKDVALSILPEFMAVSAKNLGLKENILILTATSGDTGKAALEGFKNRRKVKIVVYYPVDGVSPTQKLQMVTQGGCNVHVYGIDGNFDSAQSAVKRVFRNKEFNQEMHKRGYILSSANSINIGRLLPQIVYYFYGYCQIVRSGGINLGDEINICVPTGNFGNILAAYYARIMGLPIKTLVCASNKNKVLTDFFKSGIYNKNRRFYSTSSPSMDILLSSNLERLIYHASGEDLNVVNDYIRCLSEKGIYEAPLSLLANIDEFSAEYTNEAQTRLAISNLYKKFNYVLDTHTAVAEHAYDKYIEKTMDSAPTIIVSTASPFKFPGSVLSALGKDLPKSEGKTPLDALKELSYISGRELPKSILKLYKLPIIFDDVISSDDLEEFLLKLEMLND